ncbi:uncharacterized protein LOC120454147 [Drosophila santomea]|uniref:uncharacterized protein LOC120454147 n=1 Tax=Drosophila santomea TaxID=129105 RepID=UPI001953456F|nr:uncharacterized protein LOC120454147 [Drosophila santomea]
MPLPMRMRMGMRISSGSMINYPENDLPAMLASHSEVWPKRRPKAGAECRNESELESDRASGQWSMVDGRWSMVDGQWIVDSGWHVSRRPVSVACYREARAETSRLPQLKLHATQEKNTAKFSENLIRQLKCKEYILDIFKGKSSDSVSTQHEVRILQMSLSAAADFSNSGFAIAIRQKPFNCSQIYVPA